MLCKKKNIAGDRKKTKRGSRTMLVLFLSFLEGTVDVSISLPLKY